MFSGNFLGKKLLVVGRLIIALLITVVRGDVSGGNSVSTGGTQVLTLSPHHQLQIQALQKQAQLQLQQCLNQQVQQQPATIAVKHRRRSNAADNK